MKSLAGMRTQDFGFDPAGVLTSRVELPAARYESKEASDAFWDIVTERLRSSSGVVEAGTTQGHPLMGSNWVRAVRIAGGGRAEDEEFNVRLTYASPGLFEALRFRLLQGRAFTVDDGAESPDVVIVNEAFVRQYLGSDEDPLGATVLSGDSYSASVVGVVHDVVERNVEERPGPAIYMPIAQEDLRTRSLVVRTVGEPTEQLGAVEEAVWSIDPDLPVYNPQTMERVVEDALGGFTIIGYLMGAFALLSLLLGAVGIYGVTAYATGQRTGEIGVRLAMGAERADVVRMVVSEGGRRALLGLVVGLGMALLLGQGLSGILMGVSPRDPATFGGVAATLTVVSLLGLYIPARRASRVDPVRALTAE